MCAHQMSLYGSLPESHGDASSLPVVPRVMPLFPQEGPVTLDISQIGCSILEEEGSKPAFCERGQPCHGGGCVVWQASQRVVQNGDENQPSFGQQELFDKGLF